ncbi:MAG: sigma-54-dependent Fis family transcriptional regulator [Gemmatimonadetes bacterium]|nr:sigma-54-dependent Fis family transcriptional regulator [Gemmatimonadota bacterium]
MKPKARIYVCDDEMLIRFWLVEHLAEDGYQAEGFETGTHLLETFSEDPADLVLLDLKLPDGSGLGFLEKLKGLQPSVPVIMISAHGEVETAVAAVRGGAYHFLEKPIDLGELLVLVEQALDAQKLVDELDRYREGNRWQFSDVTLVGRSAAIQKIAGLISRFGARGTPSTVLIRGESGAGKDVVARAIHAFGPRQSKPFISVNCTVLPEHLVESELFGHERGAFTDAKEAKRGLFELADGGTIFLDEIGDMPRPAQAKLLEFLETRRCRRVGSVRDMEMDVQVLTATNRDLEEAVEAGDFREDLFYRLNVIPVVIPPLRERPEDIMPLATHFIDRLCDEMSVPRRSLSPGAHQALEAYSWPGNAREMRNLIERVLLLSDAEVIAKSDLPPELVGSEDEGERTFVLPPDGVSLDQMEKEMIFQALERSRGNKSQSARLLGISRDTLRYRLVKHGLTASGDGDEGSTT